MGVLWPHLSLGVALLHCVLHAFVYGVKELAQRKGEEERMKHELALSLRGMVAVTSKSIKHHLQNMDE